MIDDPGDVLDPCKRMYRILRRHGPPMIDQSVSNLSQQDPEGLEAVVNPEGLHEPIGLVGPVMPGERPQLGKLPSFGGGRPCHAGTFGVLVVLRRRDSHTSILSNVCTIAC